MSWLSNFFGGGNNPADASAGYLNQIPGVAHEYADPLIQRGQEATQGLPEYYKNMMQNPAAHLNEAMDAYSPSREYNFKYDQMMRAARNAAAQVDSRVHLTIRASSKLWPTV